MTSTVTVVIVRSWVLKAAQIITAVFILCLGGILISWEGRIRTPYTPLTSIYIIPSILVRWWGCS